MSAEANAFDGRQIVSEFENLKRLIKETPNAATRENDALIVTDGFITESTANHDGTTSVEKIRGGQVEWEKNYYMKPTSRVDDDPHQHSRISVERRLEKSGVLQSLSSIIYREYAELDPAGDTRVVVEKRESYHDYLATGPVRGERFAKIDSQNFSVLKQYHREIG